MAIYTKTGGGITSQKLGGADASTFTETGGAKSAFAATGPYILVLGSGRYWKRGGGTSHMSVGNTATQTITAVEGFRTGTPTIEWIVGIYTRGGVFLGYLEPILSNIDYTFNGIDSATFGCLLNGRNTDLIDEFTTVLKVWRRSETMPAIPDKPDYCGLVIQTEDSGESNTTSITTISPLAALRGRTAQGALDLTGTDQGQILKFLLDHTNSFGHTGVAMGTIIPSVNRDRVYERGQNIWAAWNDLISLDFGPDIEVTYFHEDDNPICCIINSSIVTGTIRDNVHLDYKVGKSNLSDLRRKRSGEPGVIATWVVAEGQGDDGVSFRGAPQVDTTQLANIGLWERIEQMSNVQTTALLDSFALQILRQVKEPITVYTPIVSKGLSPVYREHLLLGDLVNIAAKRGRIVVDERTRVYGASISKGEDGMEELALTTAADFAGNLV